MSCDNFDPLIRMTFNTVICSDVCYWYLHFHHSHNAIQKKTYSGKKKQNLLNLMIMMKLNGEIIYCSPLCVGADDQDHFNELNLQSLFIGEPCGWQWVHLCQHVPFGFHSHSLDIHKLDWWWIHSQLPKWPCPYKWNDTHQKTSKWNTDLGGKKSH